MNRARPILFNGDMVRAILDGRKTVTRRVIMPHNRKKAKEQGYCQGNGLWVDPNIDNGDKEGHIKDYSISSCWMSDSWYISRYALYKPGDILYVRETWALIPCIDCNMGYTYLMECHEEPVTYEDRYSISEGCFVYRTDYGDTEDDSFPPSMFKWRPSIHMPKQAARIWLKVTNVRVERLQEITIDGCEEEGCWSGHNGDIFAFMALWDSTIKKADRDRYGWNANPWVWVVEFERCGKPEVKSEKEVK